LNASGAPASTGVGGGTIERLAGVRQTLLDAGYTLDPDQETVQGLVARMREERPRVVGLVFLGRDVPFRCMLLADDERVQLRCAFEVRARARHCQEWNRTRLFTKATVDRDGDLSIQYDYPVVGDIEPRQLLEVVRLFTMSAAAAFLWFRARDRFDGVEALRWLTWGLAGWALFALVRGWVAG
jgi:hypothetical protein